MPKIFPGRPATWARSSIGIRLLADVSLSSSAPHPATLKYRSAAHDSPSAPAASRIIISPINLLDPYGLVGAVRDSSVNGRSSTGSPYTAADDEYTSRRTPADSNAASRLITPPVFCWW